MCSVEDYKKERGTEVLDSAMQVLIELRNQARSNRDWALSDQIRDQLAANGIQLKDGKDGTTYTLN
jgi:cysteinyl-tRNA synthetase